MKLGQSEAQEVLEVVLEVLGIVLVVLEWFFRFYPLRGRGHHLVDKRSGLVFKLPPLYVVKTS